MSAVIVDKAALHRIVAESELAKRLHAGAGAVVALVTQDAVEAVELGAGVCASTPMEIGSLTKPFTALLLAEAMQRGELQLSGRIDELLFGCSWGGSSAITIEELATHTSGLPRLSINAVTALRHDPYRKYTREDLVGYLDRTRPRSPSTAAFSYSNLGYAVLGLALEKAASQKYAQLLQERVLAPLSMEHTTLQLAGGDDLVCGGYSTLGLRASPWHMDAYAPCGAMVSTLDDMSCAARAFLNPAGPIATALAHSTRPRVPVPGGHIGLAWLLPEAGNAFWHNGGTAGYSSYLGVNTQRRIAVLVLANQAIAKEATELGRVLMQLIRGVSTVHEDAG